MLSSFNRGSVTILPKCVLCMENASTQVFYGSNRGPFLAAYLCYDHAAKSTDAMEEIRQKLRQDGEIE